MEKKSQIDIMGTALKAQLFLPLGSQSALHYRSIQNLLCHLLAQEEMSQILFSQPEEEFYTAPE
jgi:hypothetical protein